VSTTSKIRVLLIEDHGIVREGLKLILERTSDIEVVGEAGLGIEGYQLFERLVGLDGVDVVVTDLSLPDIDGLEITRRIKTHEPTARVLIVTMHADPQHIRGLLETGADGYLLKQSAANDLPDAIRTVARGETSLSPTVSTWLIKQLGSRREPKPHSTLTEREWQIIVMLADGSTSKEIAQRLRLSTKTVENHRARILEKFGVANTAAAIGMAYQQGLIGGPGQRIGSSL
jgi:DNA-binding NarL/FixJ family response regulator